MQIMTQNSIRMENFFPNNISSVKSRYTKNSMIYILSHVYNFHLNRQKRHYDEKDTMEKFVIKIYTRKKNEQRINSCICLYYSQMKMWNEASAGILQCKWVFDRKVRDMMQFKWIKEKKMWKKARDSTSEWGKKIKMKKILGIESWKKATRKVFFFSKST